MLEVNTLAPDFEATQDDGTLFRLSDLRGEKNVVLYFYPADFTAGCTAQACAFRDNYEELEARNAVLIGVSRDSVGRHTSFKEKHGLVFPLVSDPDSRIARLYRATGMLPKVPPRVTYVIDRHGVIRAAFRHDIAIGRHQVDTLRALDALQKAETAPP